MIVSHDHGGNPSLITRGQHHHPHQQHLMGPGAGGGGTPSSFRTLPSRQHHQQVSTLTQFFLLCFYQPRSGMVMGWVAMFLLVFWGRLAFCVHWFCELSLLTPPTSGPSPILEHSPPWDPSLGLPSRLFFHDIRVSNFLKFLTLKPHL